MNGARRARTLAYGAAIAVVALDQWLKHWIVGDYRLADGQTLALWGPLHFTLVRNPGVAYGLLRSHAQWSRWALSVFELAVAGALVVWAWRNGRSFLALAIGLVLGGAVGNLIDRVIHGAVVDFIDLQGLHFPWIFNVADSAITVGIALLIAESLFAPRETS